MNPAHNCQKELHEVDLKVTPARLAVLSILEQTKKPLDVNTVDQYLRRKSIKADKVTIFRTLNSLTQKGLAIPIQFNEGKLRYEHATKANHHHFVCENCHNVEDISDCNIQELEENIAKEKGLLIKRHSLEFFGLCAKCRQ